MQNSRLPKQVCERVIGFVPESPPWYLLPWPYNSTPWQHPGLVHYTLICSALLPSARRILYHQIVFTRASQVDRFLRTITENPCLADLVHELHVVDHGRRRQRLYIPFLHGSSSSRFPQLRFRTLGYYSSSWSCPPRYHLQIARFPITTLFIRDEECDTRSTDVLRLIWSLPCLQSLYLLGLNLRFSDSGIERLESMDQDPKQPCRCFNLTTLCLMVSRSGASWMRSVVSYADNHLICTSA